MVKENPNGCIAKSCCGKRALRRMEEQQNDAETKKKMFLKKVDSFRGKPEKHVFEDNVLKEKKKKMGRCEKWWAYSSRTVKWTVGFALVNLGFAVYGFIKAAITKPFMPTSYFFAKAGGGMLNFNCSVILVPVLRNLLSWLRTTPVNQLVPLDDNIIFHKIIFVGICAGATLHIVSHYLTYSDAAYENPDATGGSGLLSYAFFTFEGFTGHLILFFMLLMMVTALERCRRRSHKICCCWTVGGYTLFWTVHKLWMPCMFLLLLHGKKFWSYVTWPLLLTILEKVIQSYRAKQEVELIEARSLPSDVLTIKFRVKDGAKFRYKAGQYIYINCPDVSLKEWHPFTLSSAPEDEYLSCHIRCSKRLDWCYPFRKAINPDDSKLRRFDKVRHAPATHQKKKSSSRAAAKIRPMQGNDNKQPVIRIDGPYGSASEEVFEYRSLMMVGAGIGVTPFSSIMRSMSLRRKQQKAIGGRGQPMPRTHFYWLCRSRFEFDAFKDLMRNDISSNSEIAKSFTFHLYMSGETEISDAKFQAELKDYGRWAQLFTGRPRWDRIFQEIRKENLGQETGVFLCGPPPIAADLRRCSKKYSDDRVANMREGKEGGTYFTFHQENF
jgi:NADPH oxidase 2